MAILPTKNELKEVSLDTLTTYYEMLGEELMQRKSEERKKKCEEVMKLLNQAFDLAVKYNITLNVSDDSADIDIDINDADISNIGDSTITFDVNPY